MLADFYRSKEWESFRLVIINERLDSSGHSICEHCGKPIVKPYDLILHHIIELTDENYRDHSISLNPAHIQIVHHSCHNKIHKRLLNYDRKKIVRPVRKVYIVWGSPLSGKSSWVKDVMNEGDLILDMDSIWECVSGLERYEKPKRLNAVVFSIRDNILESIRLRRGKWVNAYVIGGYPFEAERERLSKELGATVIHIDTSKEECLARLETSDRDKEKWQYYISDFWEKLEGKY